MTSTNRYWERTRDVQDGAERHLFVKQEFEDGSGHYVNVKGTGTKDDEAPVIMSHVGFRLKDDTNAEVILLSGGSDTHMKFAMTMIPRDKQRKWAKGRGGVQHPTDGSFALEFQDGELHVTKGKFTVGEAGVLEVTDDKVYMRKDLYVEGEIHSTKPMYAPNPNNLPGPQPPPGYSYSDGN